MERSLIRAAIGLGAALVTAASSTTIEAQAGPDTGGVTAQQIRKVTGLAGSNDDDSGRRFKLGIAYDLRGAGAQALKGVELAVAQIAAAGGPKIELVVEDIGQPGSWQGVQAEQALRAANTPLALVGGGAAGGTMLPGLEQDRILAFDGDLGVTGSTRGRPFVWGLRASVPADEIPVGLQYLITAYRNVHSVALVYSADLSGPTLISTFTSALFDDGLKLAAAFPIGEAGQAGQSLADRLRQVSPDAVYVASGDPQSVLGAVRSLGKAVPVVGTDGPIAAQGDLNALDGYAFAGDWFDATRVANDWAKLFVASYRQRFDADPGGPAANGYEEAFAAWTLLRRVVARGGDISDGARLQQELVANRAFKSIYGGDGTELDQIVLSPTTHSVLDRPFSVYRVTAGALMRVATADIGGANFTLDAP